MRQPELTSLVGLRDDDGDRLVLVRLDKPNGKREYVLRVGTGKVSLTARDLARLGRVIRFELFASEQIRFLGSSILLLVSCVVIWLLASNAIGPLFAYPWSN